jgi:hypothetical protein
MQREKLIAALEAELARQTRTENEKRPSLSFGRPMVAQEGADAVRVLDGFVDLGELADAVLKVMQDAAPVWLLKPALERLASSEAFKGSRAIDPVADAELLARMKFAEQILAIVAKTEEWIPQDDGTFRWATTGELVDVREFTASLESGGLVPSEAIASIWDRIPAEKRAEAERVLKPDDKMAWPRGGAGRLVETLDLIAIDPKEGPPIYFVVEGYGEEDDVLMQSGRRYFYEEHDCPMNFLAGHPPKLIAIAQGGDFDPHGIVRHVRSIRLPGPVTIARQNAEGLDEALAAAFPELLESPAI